MDMGLALLNESEVSERTGSGRGGGADGELAAVAMRRENAVLGIGAAIAFLLFVGLLACHAPAEPEHPAPPAVVWSAPEWDHGMVSTEALLPGPDSNVVDLILDRHGFTTLVNDSLTTKRFPEAEALLRKAWDVK
jgi:hypothetical protein